MIVKERIALRETVFKHFIKKGFQTPDQLHFYIKEYLGFDIPRKSVCPDHCAPFNFVCDVYFERVRAALLMASRTSGKTRILSILNHLDTQFTDENEVAQAGATLDQIEKVYRYFTEYYKDPLLKPYLGKAIQSYIELSNGSFIENVTANVSGVNCLSGDTLIDCPRNMRKYPKGIPIKDLLGRDDVWVYCYDGEKIVVRKVKRVWCSGKEVEVWKLRLDNGDSLKATPEHLVMLRNGEYKELRDLKSGDNLMPFYRYKMRDGYWGCHLNNGERVREHIYVYHQVLGSYEDSYDLLHHKDLNLENNHPLNLLAMGDLEHKKLHSIYANGFKGRHHTEKTKEIFRRNTKRLWRERREEIIVLQNSNRPCGKTHPNYKEGVNVSCVTCGKTWKVKPHIASRQKRFHCNHKCAREDLSVIAKRRNAISESYKNGRIVWNKGLTKEMDTRVAKYAESMAEAKRVLYTTSEGKRRAKDHSIKMLKMWKEMPDVEYQRQCELRREGWRHKKQRNHKVVSVEFYGYEDVYDMEVEKYHNFVANGVVVHNSPHPPKVRLDEVELFDWRVLQEAFSMPASKTTSGGEFIKSQMILCSTRKYGHGVMQRLLKEAKKRRISVYVWCVFESLEKCTRRCFKDSIYGDCPIYDKCQGKAHECSAWYSIDDFIAKVLQLDWDVFSAQWLCLRPSSEARVYARLSEDVHVITWSQFQRMFRTDDIPDNWKIKSGLDLGGIVAYNKIAIAPDGTHVVFYEVYEEDILICDLAEKIKKSRRYHLGEEIFRDPSAKQEGLELEKEGIITQPANNSFAMGRDCVKKLIETDWILGRPKFFIIKEACPNLIEEIFDYCHPSFPDGTIDFTQAVKIKDHGCDATRYGIYSGSEVLSLKDNPIYVGGDREASEDFEIDDRLYLTPLPVEERGI